MSVSLHLWHFFMFVVCSFSHFAHLSHDVHQLHYWPNQRYVDNYSVTLICPNVIFVFARFIKCPDMTSMIPNDHLILIIKTFTPSNYYCLVLVKRSLPFSLRVHALCCRRQTGNQEGSAIL